MKSIENGIWLCGSCAAMIDKNSGGSYTVEKLKKWKKDHEQYIKFLVESGFNPLRNYTPSGKNAVLVQSLLAILDNKGVLFAPYAIEVPRLVISSLDDLRNSLVGLRSDPQIDPSLDMRLKAMGDACRYFMNTNVDIKHAGELEEPLGELRKFFGIHLRQISEEYSVVVKPPLASIMPL